MVTETKYKAVRSRFLLPLWDSCPDERIEDGYLVCEGQTIVEVGHYTEEVGQSILKRYGNELTILHGQSGEDQSTDAFPINNGVLLPSFVKAHGHDHEQALIGISKDEPLTDWLDHAVNPFTAFLHEENDVLRERFGCSPNLVAYRLARINDIYYGITASMVHHCNFNKYHLEEIFQANIEGGTTMFIAVGSQDRFSHEQLLDRPEDALGRLDMAVKSLGQHCQTHFLPGPDQLFSNSEKLLVPLKKWAREKGTLFHIHSSENPKTTQWFQQKIEVGFTPVAYAERLGILDAETILAHQVNCGPGDIELLHKRDTAVVHNPLANTILGSGMPPLIEMLEAGIRVAISTDGSGSADNQNILNAARTAAQYQKAFHQDATLLPAGKLLEMITRIPAQILRLNKGVLQPGKDADFIVIDLNRPNLIPTRLDNVVENLIWAADGSEVFHVVGNGRLMKYQGKLLDLGPLSIAQMLEAGETLTDQYIEHSKKYNTSPSN